MVSEVVGAGEGQLRGEDRAGDEWCCHCISCSKTIIQSRSASYSET